MNRMLPSEVELRSYSPADEFAVADQNRVFGFQDFRQIDPTSPLIDAIYIPTQQHRPELATPMATLLKHAKSVHILCSGVAPTWARYDSNVVVWENLSTYFDTDAFIRLPGNANSSSSILPEFDIPEKRQFALERSRNLGLHNIGLLDDDITLSDEDLLAARSSLSDHAAATFYVLGHPDVSTLDHIERIVMRTKSRVSPGGSSLFLRVEQATGRFPKIYNEDWIFLLQQQRSENPIAVGIARQRPRMPYRADGATRFEQLGDLLAEGMKARAEQDFDPMGGDIDFWNSIRRKQVRRVEGLLALSEDQRITRALDAAREEINSINPRELVGLVNTYSKETV
ncbi:MAG: hypothetical protein FWF02_07945 [Micrococcales bacterium]|nr:hypothetical protein [Micrococcales bacterium]MCL2667622.1 hypothetical protein [Micrococcales bacterium]